MDATIRNLDDDAYRALKAKAALEGKSVGEALNEAIRAYVGRPRGKKHSLRDIKPVDFGPGTERLSEEIDDILYGSRS